MHWNQVFFFDPKTPLQVNKAIIFLVLFSRSQGFMLLREAAKVFGWNLNYGGIALMWRGGCIIRSVFLGNIKAAYDKNPKLENLLLDDFFRDAIHNSQVQDRGEIYLTTPKAAGNVKARHWLMFESSNSFMKQNLKIK